MHLKLSLLYVLLLSMASSAVQLSLEVKSSLAQKMHLNNLEERRARLLHLGELFGNGTAPGKTNATALLSDQEITSDDSDAEPDIEDINQKAGIAEYLFQGDINLTEEQLSRIEKGITQTSRARPKRQVDRYAGLWLNKRVYYYFDPNLNAKTRTITKKALNYIQARTCVTFSHNATVPHRVRVINDVGCWSDVGMLGGEQYLSLGAGCDAVGIAAHEFAHTLGVLHMQTRDDRDNYITVDLTNVPPMYYSYFAKLPPEDVINYNPYEYGSYLHYGSNLYAKNGNSMTPLNSLYLRTLGSHVISFYDIKTINDHYLCNENCVTGPAVCTNGGEPNPRNCATCNCPGGYGGALCNQRPPGCGGTLVATNLWKVKKFSFGNAQVKTLRDTFMLCNHWITAPAGKKIQIRVTYMNQLKCGTGCRVNSIEPKVLADKRITNPRICCADMLYKVRTSVLNPTPVISYNRLLTTTFTFHYRHVDA